MAPLTEKDWHIIFREWDEHHPADLPEDEVVDDDPLPLAAIPTLDEIPDVVDYSVRAPGDWVVSGPLVGGPGRGVVFDTVNRAHQAMCVKYGSKRVYPWDAGLENRWAFLIKKA